MDKRWQIYSFHDIATEYTNRIYVTEGQGAHPNKIRINYVKIIT